jgi:hypothetical protein
VVNAWWQAATKQPGTSAGSVSGGAKRPLRRVTINVAAVAARHPAWELARVLEKDQNTPITLTPVEIRALQQAAAPEAFSVPAVDPTLGVNTVPAISDVVPAGRGGRRGNQPPGTVTGLDLPERRLIAEELQTLQQDVKARQVTALDEFLQEVQVRQDTAREEQATLLRLGLQYDIEAAQRSSLARLNPILPPEAVQLEMTSLRLQLLNNLYTTEAAREAARQRLEELIAQWREQLKQQEAERLIELRRLLTEIPTRVRREGEAQIGAYTEAARQRDAAFRQSVED